MSYVLFIANGVKSTFLKNEKKSGLSNLKSVQSQSIEECK